MRPMSIGPSITALPENPWLLDVALTPSALEARAEMPLPSRTVYIVVDVVRATTTLTVQMERGAQRVYVAANIAQARTAHRAMRTYAAREPAGTNVLLAGEAGGIAPVGFDCGNSPAELAHLDLAGREIVFATTNGTRALVACTSGAYLLAGALRNASAVARAAVTLAGQIAAASTTTAAPMGYTHSVGAPEPPSEAFAGLGHLAPTATPAAIMVVCSGRGGLPAYDDTLCAGIIAARVLTRLDDERRSPRVGEGARIALATAEDARRIGMRAALAASDAGRAVVEVGLERDLDWCAAIDATDVVPYVIGITQDELLLIGHWQPARE